MNIISKARRALNSDFPLAEWAGIMSIQVIGAAILIGWPIWTFMTVADYLNK
jgi:hypothetical protein